MKKGEVNKKKYPKTMNHLYNNNKLSKRNKTMNNSDSMIELKSEEFNMDLMFSII
jgi:hypothetical protein